MNILIVEDEPLAADDLIEKLEKLQHRVTAVAESYDAALEAIRTEKPDLALVDIELKGERSGIDLSEQLQQLAIPFLFLSGLEELDIYYKAEKTGRLHHLSKPIDLLNLRNALLEAAASVATTRKEVIHFFSDRNGIRKRIDPDQIVYLEAARSYCDVYFVDKTRWTLSTAMGNVAKKLSHPDMIQISRFHFINKKHIDNIQGKKLRLVVGPFLKVSNAYRTGFDRIVNKV